jgi:Arc/MetJ family transcription regulator
MATKIKRGTVIIALVAAIAAFAAGPAAAASHGAKGHGHASWVEASWGDL